jgi:hypothetical protein
MRSDRVAQMLGIRTIGRIGTPAEEATDPGAVRSHRPAYHPLAALGENIQPMALTLSR